MLLAGGRGTRLNILAAHRAKPAVPFAGVYRIIDFALSNCMDGKLNVMGVLTQYRPLSLMNHLTDGSPWDMSGRSGALKIMPPYQASEDFDWYHGTADAVYQNLNFIWRHKPDRVLILSGDHIYHMDYRKMIEFHVHNDSDFTIAAMPVPWEETSRFGIIVSDSNQKIVEFQEKPKEAKSNFASMGIYVFNTGVLLEELQRAHKNGGTDFGADVIPSMLGRRKLSAFPFDGYWRDVGTIDSYFDANMDLLTPNTPMDLSRWKVRTNLAYESVHAMSPAKVSPSARVANSLVSQGCVVDGVVENSILSPGVIVERGAVVKDSIVMHRSHVGYGAKVVRSIVDKHVTIKAGASVGSYDRCEPNKLFPTHLVAGLVVVGKNSIVPEGVTVGPNVIIYPGVGEKHFSGPTVEPGETIEPPAVHPAMR